MAKSISIIIATKDRSAELKALLNSIRQLRDLDKFQLEIIVGDNNSKDTTWDTLVAESKQFPVPIRPLKVKTPGKSSVLNQAMRTAHGDVVAFLDDDVVVDVGWLHAIENFFQTGDFGAGQGGIRIQARSSSIGTRHEFPMRHAGKLPFAINSYACEREIDSASAASAGMYQPRSGEKLPAPTLIPRKPSER